MIQNAVHNLTFEQIKFLNRGPTYVPPCQLHILTKSSFTLAQLVTKEMVPLRRHLTKLFTKYSVDLSRRMNFEKEIQLAFNESFLAQMPSMLEHRALYEKQIIQSIRYSLNKDQLLLRRTADDKNTYYLGQLDEFHEKSNEYIENSNSYELFAIIDENHTEEQQLKEIMQALDVEFDKLYQRKLIQKDYQMKFSTSKKTNIKLPYVYFLPKKDQDDNVLVEPRFSSLKNSPIYALANYLDEILRPLFENYSRSTTFLNGGDFIQKLDYYNTQQNFLKPQTNFVTFKIHNLSMNVSHSSLLRALGTFLVSPLVDNRFYKLSSESIEELMALVLKNIFFTFNKKLYRVMKGCPLNLPLTDLLCNIYLHDWQMSLLRQIRLKDSFYGRYHNRGFFTWNASTDYLERLFDELQQTLDSDVKLTTYIDTRVEFLNAVIGNTKGILETHVYHNPNEQQPFLLPYAKNHPRLRHRQWFRYALIRAGQYCSSFDDFEDERRYIEMTFLTNGYSLDFVEYHLRQFYYKYFRSEFQIKDINRHTYRILRRELFRLVDEEKRELKEVQQLQKNHQLIDLHYLFDWGSRCQFNERFYKLWSTIINEDPKFKKFGLKIHLNTKHCYSSNMFLAQITKDM
ncbi:unnamed protein product [Rotaria sp. Silwood1]|nr:unnamed protein product [Rotaria sp. Silwood1]CAF5071521.1 unnamed protein product [Rotaria sp. Silwood1]